MRIILICGAPGCGKSTFANNLAKEFSIQNVISTDIIRAIMRSCTSKEQFPHLHSSTTSEEYDKTNSNGFVEQSKEMRVGIQSVIDRAVKENADLIIEGIHLIPGYFNIPKEIDFRHILIIVQDEEKHKKQITGQGERRAKHKLEKFDKLRTFQDYLLNVANKNIEIMKV